jgi:hypothetical protein
MQCPSCKEQIDDDSRYCDQCGIQIMVCSECGRPGAKKFCNFDGKPMVPAGSGALSPQVQPVQPTPVQPTPVQGTTGQTGTQGQTPVQTVVQGQTPVQQTPVHQTPPPAASNTVKFSGNGIVFEAKDGDIIGRKTGSFINIFASYQYVSGTHCKIIKLPAGWHIQDLNSSNGTFVQGNKLAPNAPYPLQNGIVVKIATTDFTVTFDDGGGSTTKL